MRSKMSDELMSLFLLLMLTLSISACALAPKYPGHPQEPQNLTKVEENGVSLGLPPGWKVVSAATPRKGGADFKKQGTSLSLSVTCNSPFLSRSADGEIPRKTVMELLRNAKIISGPFALGSTLDAPVFEAYSGTSEQLEMVIYFAYNIEKVFKGCKYQVLLVGNKRDAADIEPEFVAIVRSMM